MARVVLENVRVDFPIYATQRNLRTAIFNRATGGLIQRQGKNQDRVVVKALVRRLDDARGGRPCSG